MRAREGISTGLGVGSTPNCIFVGKGCSVGDSVGSCVDALVDGAATVGYLEGIGDGTCAGTFVCGEVEIVVVESTSYVSVMEQVTPTMPPVHPSFEYGSWNARQCGDRVWQAH